MVSSSARAPVLKLSLFLFLGILFTANGIEESQCLAGEDGCDAAATEEASTMKASLLQSRAPKKPSGKGTCKGMCFSHYVKGRSCQCNAGCQRFKSCCSDYTTECGGNTTKTANTTKDVGAVAGKGTCKGMCSSHYVRGGSCQCNAGCERFKSCCPDYKTECGGNTTKAVKTCSGRCDSRYDHSKPCQCNPTCHKYNSCCPDYTTECAAEPDEASSGKRLNLFMFNPHGECFMPWTEDCTTRMGNFTDGILEKKHIDFATLAYTSGKYVPPTGWKSFNHTCKGAHIDDIMMVYNSEKWKPIGNYSDPSNETIDSPMASPIADNSTSSNASPIAGNLTSPNVVSTDVNESESDLATWIHDGLASWLPTGDLAKGKKWTGYLDPALRDKAVHSHDSGGESGCMERGRGGSMTRPYFVQAFQSTENASERVVVVSGHFSHHYFGAYGLKFMVSSMEELQKRANTDKLIIIADTNMRASGGTLSPKIMEGLGVTRRRGTTQSTKFEATCCNHHMNIKGYDRIMANFGTRMQTVLPLPRAPRWAKNNFHLPMLGFLDY